MGIGSRGSSHDLVGNFEPCVWSVFDSEFVSHFVLSSSLVLDRGVK